MAGDATLRLALPKGRIFDAALAALRAAGYRLAGLEEPGRRLHWEFPDEGLEAFILKDWDLPLYVEQGIADAGIVGSDVIDEVDGDLLTPLALFDGRCRLSLIGRPGTLPRPGAQVRLASKYTQTARAYVATAPWSAEVVRLSGSVELAPVLGLAELALDVVQTGRTLLEHGLVELAVVREVAPRLVVNRGAFLRHRRALGELCERLERAGVAQ